MRSKLNRVQIRRLVGGHIKQEKVKQEKVNQVCKKG